MTRHPDTYDGVGTAVHGDVNDSDSLAAAADGCDVAYYLVHSLEDDGFQRTDAEAAWKFGTAAAHAYLTRIVYLGGLGADNDDLSSHLQSRREVEGLLGAGGVPVTTLRAGIIIGDGGLSWEITRQLVEHLPAMVTPLWVSTRTQPIAIDDVIRYLVGVLELPQAEHRTFEIGGPDVLRYIDMLRRVAEIEHRRRLIVPVPLLTPSLSARWLSLVTDINTRAGRHLVDSMTNEVLVRDNSIRDLIDFELMDFDSAVRRALSEHTAVAS